MNKINQSIFLCLFFAHLTFSPAVYSQANNGDIFLGAGLTYGEKFEEIGLQLGGYYVLNPDMRVGGDFTYWLIDSPAGLSNTYFELNGNFHYLFYNENNITLYGIGSLGIHYASWEFAFMNQKESHSDTELGLGLGAGAEYLLGPVKIYAEPRLFLTGFDQFCFSFGVRYGL